jgi:hypothetical protein
MYISTVEIRSLAHLRSKEGCAPFGAVGKTITLTKADEEPRWLLPDPQLHLGVVHPGRMIRTPSIKWTWSRKYSEQHVWLSARMSETRMNGDLAKVEESRQSC